MPRALVVTRRTFCAPRCLRACAGWVCCPLFERGVRRVTVDALSASVASDTTADTTDATATATAEAVTEAVKRPQPDADSAADEQPDADTARPGQLARLNSPEPRPVDPGNARPVTAERRQREAQQPRPDAEVLLRLLREALKRFRVASDAAHEARVRADEAVEAVEAARNALGFRSTTNELRKLQKLAEKAAVETADAARAANFAANASLACQRQAKHFADCADERGALTVERARVLAHRAANAHIDALEASAAADAQRQRAAAFLSLIHI